MFSDVTDPGGELDVLVVGAGPTGLTLAAQLERFGVRFRIIDRMADRTRESRALAVQARSLEVLQSLGLGEVLAARGRTATRLMLHVDRGEPVAIDLGSIGRPDTRFPYILFVSQADTEAVLTAHLESRGVTIERGVELAAVEDDHRGHGCVIRHPDGLEERIRVRYLAGCDGAHSTVRKIAGIQFEGGAYPQDFALGDVEADGPLQPGAINAFGAGRGLAVFFPLGHPATWRVMAMEARGPAHHAATAQDDITARALSLAELQTMIAGPTFGAVRLRDAAWLTRFRLHHRQAARYQKGRLFLAGDAAHIHSPVGGQGMNTGIQDAWNLGWKIGLVVQERADDRLLASYHAERWPVGRTLLRATDRLFSLVARSASGSPVIVWLRRLMARGLVAPALARPGVRALGFHFVSQLGIRYRTSPAVIEGEPRLRQGPRAGDRLPDAPVHRDGHPTYLQQELSAPGLHLLLCGRLDAWNPDRLSGLRDRFAGLLMIQHLTADADRGGLIDRTGEALARLGAQETSGQYLVRPDGHIAFRCAGSDLAAVIEYMQQWFTEPSREHRAGSSPSC
jgi:2-polyprenyl-6-methoxyphenol hydroxylase-like FAD-dependent oxidoreductase